MKRQNLECQQAIVSVTAGAPQTGVRSCPKCLTYLQVKDLQPAYGEIKDPNFWQQLDVEGNKPTVQTPATPHWGMVKGFAKKESDTDDGPGWTTEETNNILMAGKFPSYERGNPTSGYKVIVSDLQRSSDTYLLLQEPH